MAEVGMDEVKSQLSNLVKRVEAGEETVITRRGEPAARPVPERHGEGFASLLGAWRGRVKIVEDSDEPPGDLGDALG